MGIFDFWKTQKTRRLPVRHRAYQGAESGRLTASWSNSTASADAEIYKGVKSLRARSRDERRNNPYITRYMNLLATNVVGPRGVVLQAQCRNFKGRPDTAANDAIEAWWRGWGKRCDYTGQLNWIEMQRQVIQAMAEDGEVFIEMIAGDTGLELLSIDPELIDINHNADLKNGDYIKMGIERSPSGRAIAYHVQRKAASSSVLGDGYFVGDTKPRRVMAGHMLHIFIADRVGQTRGIPWTASILWRLKMHHGYTDAAVTAARVGAAKMGFYTTPDGQPYTGDDVAGDGASLMDSAEPGVFETLPEGVGFESFNPDYPHAQYAEFDKSMLRSHASGLNVAHHALSNDLEGVNFSSIRAGVLEDRESWKALQEMMIARLCEPVYEAALMQDLIALRVPQGAGSLSFNQFEKYKVVIWQGRRWPWVDPLKDIKADELAYKLNVKSLSQIIRDMGKDPEDVWREIERENGIMKQYGLVPEDVMDTASKTDASDAPGGQR